MDRYDALLEHLKMTQRHSLDAVANRLSDFVAQLENLVDAMKTSVQDALPSDANELFPINEFETELAELAELDAAAEVEPRPSTGVSLENLRVLDAAKSQSELLRALLPLLSTYVGRAVVFVIRDGVVTAWSGIGFDNSEDIRTWSGGIAASPNLSQLIASGSPLMIDPQADPLVSEWLTGHGVPGEGALLPISLRGKLMGIVYVDHEGDQPWALDAAQAHIVTACLLIDTLHNRTQSPSPMLVEVAPFQREAAHAASHEDFESATELEPEPTEPDFGQPESASFEPAAEAPDFDASQNVDEIEAAPVAEQSAAEEVGDADYDFEPEPVGEAMSGADEAFDPSATMRVEVADETPATDFEPPTQQSPPQPSFAHDAEPVEPPSVEESEAPPPVRPIEPPAEDRAASPAQVGAAEDDPRHEEARRFARLLVSEIKLYNEDEVDRGRIEKDLATRLKEDIDRSREMFEKRISAEIRSGHNFFQEELVRILADGNPDALGG